MEALEHLLSRPSFRRYVDNTRREALLGGIAGSGAQAANILPLMWLRTIMEYQYKHGGDFAPVARRLYAEGGIPRFYRGLLPALVLAPVARFGDTAANEMALTSLAHTGLPIAVKTGCASATAAVFRLFIMPLDAWKVMKQVQGKEGLQHLVAKARKHPTALWHGATGMLAAGVVGHFPFFFTNNFLHETVPSLEFRFGKYIRNGLIGFTAALASDCTSNPIRVLKVVRQTSLTPVSYTDAARAVLREQGIFGFYRGLKTRIVSNGIQGAVFVVLWRAISDKLHHSPSA